MSHLLVDPRIPLRSDGSSPDTADRIKAILAGILYDITPSKTKALAGTGKDTAEPPSRRAYGTEGGQARAVTARINLRRCI
jgi:hypothetical protein